ARYQFSKAILPEHALGVGHAGLGGVAADVLQADDDRIHFFAVLRDAAIVADAGGPDLAVASLPLKTLHQQRDDVLGWWLLVAVVGGMGGDLSCRADGRAEGKNSPCFLSICSANGIRNWSRAL